MEQFETIFRPPVARPARAAAIAHPAYQWYKQTQRPRPDARPEVTR